MRRLGWRSSVLTNFEGARNDEHNFAYTLALVFERKGYKAKVAYDAESALALFQYFPADVPASATSCSPG